MTDTPSLFKKTPESTVLYQEAASAVNQHLDAIEYDGAEATLASPPLTADEAKEITESIKSASETLYVLIYRAHAGKAWEALGYSTFEDYVKEEFDISRSRAYRLLSQASVMKEIEAAAPPGSVIKLKEKDAYQLRNMLDQILPEVEKLKQAQATGNEEDTNFMIEEILREAKEKSLVGEQSEKEKMNSQPHVYSGLEMTESEAPPVEYDNDLGAAQAPVLRSPQAASDDDDDYSYIDDDFIADIMSSSPIRPEPKRQFPEGTAADNSEDEETTGEPEELSIGDEKNFEYSYALMTAVSNLKGLPSPNELVKVIPSNNLEKMKEIIPGVIEWLKEFQEKLEETTSEEKE